MPTAYGKAAVGTGTEFPIPEIDDGLYPAIVKEIKDGKSTWEGVESPQYIVEWELLDMVDASGKAVTLAQFVRIPDGVINDGILNENSKLYELMSALGCDMEEPEIEPDQWIGESARIFVENKKVESGKNAGQIRPRITAVKPVQKKAAAPARQPVAATARRTARPQDDF